MPPAVVVTVPARAALAGNPSDLYGGAVLAVPVPSLRARVEISDAPRAGVHGHPDGRRLVEAAMTRSPAPAGLVEVRWTTDIPRSVGLAGSSALVVATLRALDERAGVSTTDLDLAQRALAVETEELGIVAGLQDRAVQAAGRPVLVDVSGAAPAITPLAPQHLLRIAIAWLPGAAGDSGAYHRDVRDRTDGDRPSLMAELARIARAAAGAFTAGDAHALSSLMADSARVRDEAAPLSAEHQRLADTMRAAGFAPNSAGSGGAVAAVVLDDSDLDRAAGAVRALGGDLFVEAYGSSKRE